MILFFHFFLLFTKYVVTALSKSLSNKNDESKVDGSASNDESENEANSTVVAPESAASEAKYLDGKLKFFPPVYVQRYEAVYLVLQEPPWKDTIRKVVDFGCSELSFFLYLKRIPGLEEILEIDVNEDVLQRYKTKVAPLHADYVMCERPKPLDVYVLAGSIADYDDHLVGTDAVIAIEVIEHLKQDVLDKVPHNIFNEIRPRLAIFTTPNSDFNALFPNFVGFRHADHQFEWSRKEFYEWTTLITKNYPNYTVRFYGIGVGPEGTENLGCCTQMAVFERHDDLKEQSSVIETKGINNYKLIAKYEYPFYVDQRTLEEKVLDEISYRMTCTIDTTGYLSDDGTTSEIPLREFMEYISQWCSSEEELRAILVNHGFFIKEKEGCPVLVSNEPVTESSVHSEEEGVSFQGNDESKADCVQENWDWEYGDGQGATAESNKYREDELRSCTVARSLHELSETTGTVKMKLSGFERGDADVDEARDVTTLGNTNQSSVIVCSEVASVPHCPVRGSEAGEGHVTKVKSKSVTLSRIPTNKSLLRGSKQTKSKANSLVRHSSMSSLRVYFNENGDVRRSLSLESCAL